jgi:hypothetical protein
MVNIYLETMTEIILKYQGTIDEFIGDGILVIFGAPFQRPDDARRAVACAVAMQLAMAKVNDRNRQAGYPQVALGIGVNTGKMVVGNIGPQMAEITAEILPSPLANLRLSLYDSWERLITDSLYAKVLTHLSDHPPVFQINFTAIPPEADTFLSESMGSSFTD